MFIPDKDNLPEGVTYNETTDCITSDNLFCSWDFYVKMLNHSKVKEVYEESNNVEKG